MVFSSITAGDCQAPYLPGSLAVVAFPWPTGYAFTSTADGDNQTWTLSSDSSRLSTVDYNNAACNTIAVRALQAPASSTGSVSAAAALGITRWQWLAAVLAVAMLALLNA